MIIYLQNKKKLQDIKESKLKLKIVSVNKINFIIIKNLIKFKYLYKYIYAI